MSRTQTCRLPVLYWALTSDCPKPRCLSIPQLSSPTEWGHWARSLQMPFLAGIPRHLGPIPPSLWESNRTPSSALTTQHRTLFKSQLCQLQKSPPAGLLPFCKQHRRYRAEAGSASQPSPSPSGALRSAQMEQTLRCLSKPLSPQSQGGQPGVREPGTALSPAQRSHPGQPLPAPAPPCAAPLLLRQPPAQSPGTGAHYPILSALDAAE